MVFAVQRFKVNDLFPDLKSKKRFKLLDGIGHRRFGIGLSAYGLVEVVACEFAEGLVETRNGLTQSRVFFPQLSDFLAVLGRLIFTLLWRLLGLVKLVSRCAQLIPEIVVAALYLLQQIGQVRV